MSDILSLSRQALKDSEHPLYLAAWLIFNEKMNVKAADQMLAPRKEQVIPFLLDILNTEELYLEASLGSGYAPVHAVELLGRWQVMDALPKLLEIFEEEDRDSRVWDRSIQALEDFGPAITDSLLQAARQTKDQDLQITYTGILGTVGKGNPQVFEYIKGLFERQKDEWDVRYMAENLLNCDTEQAIALLEEKIRQRKYNKHLREVLESYIEQARKGELGVPRKD